MAPNEDAITKVTEKATFDTNNTLDERSMSSGKHDYDNDLEKNGEVAGVPHLQRKLKSRHLQMIAIGTSILLVMLE